MPVGRWQAVSILVHVKKACNSNRIFVGVGSPNPYGLRAGRPRPYDFDSRFALSFYMSQDCYTAVLLKSGTAIVVDRDSLVPVQPNLRY